MKKTLLMLSMTLMVALSSCTSEDSALQEGYFDRCVSAVKAFFGL